MKMVRWGICVLSVGAMFAFSGCARTFGRWQSPAAYDEEMLQKEMNDKQSSMITALTFDKEHLTAENAALRSQAEDKGKLVDALNRIIEGMKDQMAKAPQDTTEGVTFGRKPTGEAYVGIQGDVLFASGEATLKPKGEKTLKEIVKILSDKPNKLAVCGYTDSDPIKRTKWADNFDLSGARARAVLNFLEKEGIRPERLHFRGYGQYDLMNDASGKENKAKSRRAEIILLNDTDVAAPATTPRHSAPKPPKPPVTPK